MAAPVANRWLHWTSHVYTHCFLYYRPFDWKEVGFKSKGEYEQVMRWAQLIETAPDSEEGSYACDGELSMQLVWEHVTDTDVYHVGQLTLRVTLVPGLAVWLTANCLKGHVVWRIPRSAWAAAEGLTCDIVSPTQSS